MILPQQRPLWKRVVLTAVRNDASAIQHATRLDKLDPDIISECCRDPAFTFHMANISLEELETVFPVTFHVQHGR